MRFSRRRIDPAPWLAALVAAAVFAAFAKALTSGFVFWDDDIYLFRNPVFQLPAAAVARWALTSTLFGHFMPLVWLSFALDYAVWGLQPWGFHLTSLAWHAAASVLAFYALRELLARGSGEDRGSDRVAYAAAAGALFFAVHPLRAESAVWIAERKDVVAAAFWMASVLAYLRGRPWLSLSFFAASLLGKVSGLALPGALLVADVWPLRRLPADPRRWLDRPLRGVWREKAAFGAVAVSFAALSMLMLRRHGNLEPLGERGWLWRLDACVYSFWFYLQKTVWPAGLAPVHVPRPWFGTLWPQGALLSAGAAGAALLLWRWRRSAPWAAAAIASYALILLPALGLVQNGVATAASDRYAYLASLPLAALAGAAVLRASRRRPAAAYAVAAAALLALGARAAVETAVWTETETLWRHEPAVEEPCAAAFMNLGLIRAEAGRYRESLAFYELAGRADETRADLDADLGGALARLGRREDAAKAFRRALAKQPGHRQAGMELGKLLAEGPRSGWAEAERLLRAAGQRVELGALLASEGRTAEARREYEAALAADPKDGQALNNLGLLLDARGERERARSLYRRALYDARWRALAQYNWGNSLLAERDGAGAERHFREAMRLDPKLARARVNLGNVLALRGRLDQAARLYSEALALEPGLVEARANLSAVRRVLRR